MGIQTSAAERFEMINRAIQHDANELSISSLCKIAGVSRSGYYAWINAATGRQKREEQDRADFALILQAYNYRGYQKGARSIYMRLLHQDPPVIMNIKNIRLLIHQTRIFRLS